MRIRIIIFLMLFSSIASAQCPNLSISADSILCSGDTLNIVNTSTGGQSYLWDFCPGDIENGLDTSYIGNFSAELPSAYDNSLVYTNGQFYGFFINSSGKLIRFEFGNSLTNAPTVFDLGNLGILSDTWGIDIIKTDSLWYGFISTATNKLFKVSFGPNISNNLPIVSTIITTGANFSWGTYLKVVKDSNNYFAAVVNITGANFSLVNFGNSLLGDSATVVNYATVTGTTYGIDIAKDCNQWFIFTSDLSSGNIERFDFGNSLTNIPTTTSFTPSNSLGGSRAIQVIFDNGKWYILLGHSDGSILRRVRLGNSIVNTTAIEDLLINVPSSNFGFDMLKVDSKWHGLQSEYNTGTVNTLIFEDSCNANVAIDTNYNPIGITYLSNGTFYYSLEAIDPLGNFSYLSDSVSVNSSPISLFNSVGSCLDSAIIFNDLSTISNSTINSWLWNFGDGFTDTIQNTQHTYLAPGNFLVSLNIGANNGCTAIYSDSLSVSKRPIANFGFVNNQCLSKTIQFTDSTTSTSGVPAFWFWDFGDGDSSIIQNPVHKYNSPGTYNVRLITAVAFGCNDTIAKQITIIPAPEPNFTILNSCINDSAFFLNTTTIQTGILTNYYWNFGDGDTSVNTDPFHAYISGINTYNVQLIAYSSNGCSDTLNREIKINIKPVPGFTMSDTLVCVDELITLTDTSIIAGDTLIATLWNFGDSNSDTNNITTHSYNAAGIYTITLTSFSPSSCDSSVTKTITVIDKPNVSFSYNSVCKGDTVFFINTSTAATGSSIISTSWNFGDGMSDTLFSISHLYGNFGIYNVTLLVTDDKGCSASSTQSINVFDLPIADFNLSATCSDINIQFTDATILNGDTIQQYFWDFGDLVTSNIKNPTHVYGTPGTYTIELIVISTQGCSDTISKTFNFNQTPLATFNFAQTCDGNPVPFTYLPTVFPSPVTNWLWTFGDGGISTIINPAHIYANPGAYNVTLTVSDTINNCSSTVSKTVSVDPIPNVNFIWSGNCKNEYIEFEDSSNISSGALINWDWDFGDGINGNGISVNHLYDTIGIFNVKLIARSIRGCRDSLNRNIIINEIPEANFSFNPSFGSAPIIIDFNNISMGASSFIWNFGDTTATSSDVNPNHLYQNSGIYFISLIAENTFGCFDTLQQTINVFNPRNDIAIQNVLTELDGNLLTVKVIILNVGNITINSVQLNAQAESYGTITEFWNGNLEPNSAQQLYTFKAQFNIDEFNPPEFICVEAIQPNELDDYNTSNNKLCILIDNEIQFINPFPNPFITDIFLGINLPITELMKISIYDSNGSMVKELYNAITSKGFQFIKLNSANISDGYYILQVDYLNKTHHFPLIKK